MLKLCKLMSIYISSIFNKPKPQNNESQQQQPQSQLEITYNKQDIINAFEDGTSTMWISLKVILYDMYKNMEIVDYTSLVDAIANKLTEIGSNKTIRDLKFDQFKKEVIGINNQQNIGN